jgi:hypothetical protein
MFLPPHERGCPTLATVPYCHKVASCQWTLVPNSTGLVEIRIDREDARLGYIMVEDWEGKSHQIPVRGREGDIIALPVPKIRHTRP